MTSGWKQQSVQLRVGWVPQGRLLLSSYVSSRAACFHTWHIRACWQINVWALNGTQHDNITHYGDVIRAAPRNHAEKNGGWEKGPLVHQKRADTCNDSSSVHFVGKRGVKTFRRHSSSSFPMLPVFHRLNAPVCRWGASWVISLDKNTACCWCKRGSRLLWGQFKPTRLKFEAKWISWKPIKCAVELSVHLEA